MVLKSDSQTVYVKKSRKAFICNCCRKWIDVGSSYINVKKQVGIYFENKRYHDEKCYEKVKIMNELIY